MTKPCGLMKPCHLVKPVSATRVSGRYLTHQNGLPSLPVPPLQQTCERYISALEPIIEAEELKHTKELVDEFQKAGGVGERLQRGLEKRASNSENWVSSTAGLRDWSPAHDDPERIRSCPKCRSVDFINCVWLCLCSCQSGGYRLLTSSTACLWLFIQVQGWSCPA